MNTRKSDVFFRLGEISFRRQSRMNLEVLEQLPSYQYVYNRYLTLASEKPLRMPQKTGIVINELAEELRDIWIYMNHTPMTFNGVVRKLQVLLKKFTTHSKIIESKRGPKWKEEYDAMKLNLQNGYDIKAVKQDVIDRCIETYGVEYGDEEEKMYKDNCVPDPETKLCPRLRWNGSTDRTWVVNAKRRQAKITRAKELAANREKRQVEERQKLAELKEEASQVSVDLNEEDISMEKPQREEDLFTPPKRPKRVLNTGIEPSDRTTRSSLDQGEGTKTETVPQMPKIKVRESFKTFNPNIIEALVVIISVYKVDARQAPDLLVYIANHLFGQEWVALPEKESKKEEEEKLMNYDYVLPHRSNIASKLSDFSLLSFLDMAESIENAKANEQVVTYGTDDTTKAAGFKKFDMKTNHITIIGEDKTRETYTSGFYENISHKGIHAADTIRHDIAKMAVLTDNSYKEMEDMIDFFMTDRAGDADTMLNELGIEEERRLKCNAHILLAVDNAMDTMLKDTETLIGKSKVISENAAHVFNSNKSSIWYLGLIAFAKLLSPSHSKESVSLYTDYTKFLREHHLSTKEILEGFKGFQGNRFGRIGEISTAIIRHLPFINEFFEKMVLEHSNKLVLAVHAYQRSQWFIMCCEIGRKIYQEVTLPIKQMLRIDEYKNTTGPEHTWDALKEGFKNICKSLGASCERTDSLTPGRDKLELKVKAKIKEAMEGQLSGMKFYRGDDVSPQVQRMMFQTPKTNLGCEGEFSHGDMDLKRAGGSTSLKTVSDKHVIKRNAFYAKSKWTSLSVEEKRRKWRWASASPQAKKVRVLTFCY